MRARVGCGVLGLLVLGACSDSNGSMMGDGGPAPDSSLGDGSGGDAGSTECALDADGRGMVAELVDQLLRDALFVAAQSHLAEVGFSHSLPFTEEGYRGVLFRMFPCTEETWYVPYCDDGGTTSGGSGEMPSEFFNTRNRCIRLGCDAADVNRIQVYFTDQPHDQPNDPHAFSYPATSVSGTVTFDPNPEITWSVAEASESRRDVSAQIARALRVELDGGASVDLQHSGTAGAMMDGGELLGAALSLVFPGASSSGDIIVELSIEENLSVSGTVAAGTAILGRYGGTFENAEAVLPLTWESGCGG